MTGLVVSLCPECGWRGFPQRLWCPSCGATELGEATVSAGVVQSVTSLARSLGRSLEAPVQIVDVSLHGGGKAVARGSQGLTVGQAVELVDADGVPVAAPAKVG